MFSEVAWNKPKQWHLDLSSSKITMTERVIAIVFFSGLTALSAQIAGGEILLLSSARVSLKFITSLFVPWKKMRIYTVFS